jgi:hypothetical protein
MDFKIDFNELPKSRNVYYLGFAMLTFSIILLFYSIYTTSLYLILYFFFFSINGLRHIYEGSGKSINSIFGERFLSVDEEKIEFKEKSRKQSIVVYWDNVESIKFAATKFVINSKEKKKIEIDYGKLSYAIVQQLKETLSAIEKQKLGI